MKSFNELNYYDMLEISVNASDFEIRQAYKDMLSIYNEDSSVTYSLFSDEGRKQILESIEFAFATLIDKDTRIDYDGMLVQSGRINKSDLIKTDSQKLIPIFGNRNSGRPIISNGKIKEKVKNSEVKEITTQIFSKELISGNDIKKLRKMMGIELEEVYEVTRIRASILKSLEEDNIEKLPSGSYIQYLLKLYADFLRIDSRKIIEGYLKNINESLRVTS